MSLILIPHPDNPWSGPEWRLAIDYPRELADELGDNHLAAEQLYALALSHGISGPDDPCLNAAPFPQKTSMYNAMAADALAKRLRAARAGFVSVYLVQMPEEHLGT